MNDRNNKEHLLFYRNHYIGSCYRIKEMAELILEYAGEHFISYDGFRITPVEFHSVDENQVKALIESEEEEKY